MSSERLFTAPFVLCGLANLLQGIAFNLFLHFPGFLKGLGAGEVTIGWIAGLTAVAAIVVRPAVGRSLDTHGRRRIILLGNAMNVGVLGLDLTVTSIGPWIGVIRILHGLAEALLFTALFSYAADHVPEKRMTQGLALFGISGMLPISLGGVIGDGVLARAGYDLLFIVSLGLAVLAFIASLPLRDGPRTRGTPESVSGGFRAVLLQSDLTPVWWMTGVFSVALAALFVFLKTFVMQTGFGSIGGFFTAYTGVAVLLRATLGWLPDRLGPKRLLPVAIAALASGWVRISRAGYTALYAIAAGILVLGSVIFHIRDRDHGP